MLSSVFAILERKINYEVWFCIITHDYFSVIS